MILAYIINLENLIFLVKFQYAAAKIRLIKLKKISHKYWLSSLKVLMLIYLFIILYE